MLMQSRTSLTSRPRKKKVLSDSTLFCVAGVEPRILHSVENNAKMAEFELLTKFLRFRRPTITEREAMRYPLRHTPRMVPLDFC